MSNILTIGFAVEGDTDRRFLESVIQRTFEEIALICVTNIEVYAAEFLPSPKLGSALQNIVRLSKNAFERGMNVLCIHVDADAADEQDALLERINPGLQQVMQMENGFCQNMVPVIPVHMSEAWILADKDLLKEEIGTTLSNQDLGIDRKPETIADPKQLIEEALRIAQQNLPNRRQQAKIGVLYQPLGQKISLEALETLESYVRFKKRVRDAFVRLNYLH